MQTIFSIRKSSPASLLSAVVVTALAALPCVKSADGQAQPSRQTEAGHDLRRDQLKIERSRISNLMQASAGVPIPMAANALLLLGESGALHSDQSRRELAMSVLELARSLPLTPALKASTTSADSATDELLRASALQIDRVSITLRAARMLAGVDELEAVRALDLLITLPQPQDSCYLPAGYDYDLTYEVVGIVADHANRRSATSYGGFTDVVTPFFRNLTTAAQLTPALQLLSTMDSSSPDYKELFALLAGSLFGMKSNSVDFLTETSPQSYGTSRAVRNICAKQPTTNDQCEPLLQAYRSWLLKSLNEELCVSGSTPNSGRRLASNVVTSFNSVFKNRIDAGTLAPLTLPQAIHIKAGTIPANLWQTSRGKSLLGNLQEWEKLKAQLQSPAPIDIDKEAELKMKIIMETEGDKVGEEPLSFTEKAYARWALIPSSESDMQMQAILDYAQLLSGVQAYLDEPAEWLYWMNKLRGKSLSPREASEVRAVFQTRGNQGMRLYSLDDAVWQSGFKTK